MENPAFDTGDLSDYESSQNGDHDSESAENISGQPKDGLIYQLCDEPPWYECVFLGIQHCLLSIGGLIGIPLLLASSLCMPDDEVGYVGQAMVLNSLFFVSGIMTFLQTTFGTRLPILQGASFSFIPPTFAILALPQNQCPSGPVDANLTDGDILYNDTDGTLVDGSELWMRRMRQIQGAIAVASVAEVILGACGAIGFLIRFLGPITIGVSISLIALPLYDTATGSASVQWGIAFFTIALLIIFSQYLRNWEIPIPAFTRVKGCYILRSKLIKMFPVLITIILAWLLCLILTQTGVFPDDPNEYGYGARTDVRISVMYNSPWFRFPYPGQFGLPVVTGAGVVGMLAGVLAGIIESVGDYYACARLSGAPPIPKHALNRGITMEGIGCVLSGVVGTGTGTTSYSENIGAIGVTRVGSRTVLQVAGLIFFVFGMLGKIGAVFVLIPDPVIGGLFFIMFGMITAVGLSNFQHVDLNSSRNLFIIGFSIFTGLSVPIWVKDNPEAISTGVEELDQIFLVLLETSMLVGGIIAAFLDNTLPGTSDERGMNSWAGGNASDDEDTSKEEERSRKDYMAQCYNLPFSTNWKYSRYVPFLPEFGTELTKGDETSKL